MRHLISAVALMLLYNVGYAAIGTITEQVNAPPSIVRKAAVLSAAKGSGVEADDNVRTTAGKVGITFTDNTRVQINENSKLVIDSFVFDPNAKKSAGKLAMNVALGTVRYTSGKVAHNNPDSVRIKSPTATVAVGLLVFTLSGLLCATLPEV